MPSVSVIIPTYNRRQLLDEAIRSVFRQSLENVELLVLDDGSTDGTEVLLRHWAAREPDRFRWFSHPNMGQVATVNRGFELARSDHLYVLNSDDFLYPNGLAALHNALLDCPEAVLAYGDWRTIDHDGRILADVHLRQFSAVEILTWAMTVGAGVMYTRRLVDELGGWAPRFAVSPDWHFWIHGTRLGPYVHVPLRIAVYRYHQGTITWTSRGRKSAETWSQILEDFFDRPDLPLELKETQDFAFRNMYIMCGLSFGTDINGPGQRYVFHDRLTWMNSFPAPEPSEIADLLGWKDRALDLQRALADVEMGMGRPAPRAASLQNLAVRLAQSPMARRVPRRQRRRVGRLLRRAGVLPWESF